MQLRAVFSKEVSFSLWQTGVVRHLKGLSWWLSGKESACSAGDTGDEGSIPGLERSPGGGYGKPLQYSCLENSMDKTASHSYLPASPTSSHTYTSIQSPSQCVR